MGWLEKRPENQEKSGHKRAGLPSLDLKGVKLPKGWEAQKSDKLPNASIVYGIGSGLMFAAALYSFFTGAWLTGALLCVPAGVFFAFALYYIRYAAS